MAKGNTRKQTFNAAHLGFEANLWATADKLRGNLASAEYKHVVLGLILCDNIQSGDAVWTNWAAFMPNPPSTATAAVLKNEIQRLPRFVALARPQQYQPCQN